MHVVTRNSVKAPVLHEILAFGGKGISPRIHGNDDTVTSKASYHPRIRSTSLFTLVLPSIVNDFKGVSKSLPFD